MKKIKKIVLTLFMLVFAFTVLSATAFASSQVTVDTHRGAVKGSNSTEYAGGEMGNSVKDKFFWQYGKGGKKFSLRMYYMSNGQYAYCVEYQEPVAKTPYNATRLEDSDW